MPAMPAPAAGELASLLEYLRYQHLAFVVTSYGLTDEQARCDPTASDLCNRWPHQTRDHDGVRLDSTSAPRPPHRTYRKTLGHWKE